MKHSQRRNGKLGNMRTVPFLLLAVFGSLLCIIALSFAISLILYKTSDPARYVALFSSLSLILTGALMGVVIPLIRREGGFAVSSLSALLASIVLIALGMVLSGGKLPLYCAINYAAFIATTSLTSALITKRRTRRHR